jgi:hypothetical protein
MVAYVVYSWSCLAIWIYYSAAAYAYTALASHQLGGSKHWQLSKIQEEAIRKYVLKSNKASLANWLLPKRALIGQA